MEPSCKGQTLDAPSTSNPTGGIAPCPDQQPRREDLWTALKACCCQTAGRAQSPSAAGSQHTLPLANAPGGASSSCCLPLPEAPCSSTLTTPSVPAPGQLLVWTQTLKSCSPPSVAGNSVRSRPFAESSDSLQVAAESAVRSLWGVTLTRGHLSHSYAQHSAAFDAFHRHALQRCGRWWC